MPRVVHFEIPSDDPERAVAFFEKAFGWRISKWDGPVDYWLVSTGEAGDAGIDGGIAVRGETNPRVANMIDVPNLDEYIAKVEANGGEIVVPKRPVPGVGWMAYFNDTEGNLHGMMQSDPGAQ